MVSVDSFIWLNAVTSVSDESHASDCIFSTTSTSSSSLEDSLVHLVAQLGWCKDDFIINTRVKH